MCGFATIPRFSFFIPRTLFRHSAHSFLSFRAIRFIMPSILFLSFRASARNPAHRCFTSLSMTRPAVPSTLFFIPRTPFRHSEHTFLSFRAYFFVIPSILFCHSEHTFSVIPNAVRNPAHGCFASLSMTKGAVVLSVCEESISEFL